MHMILLPRQARDKHRRNSSRKQHRLFIFNMQAAGPREGGWKQQFVNALQCEGSVDQLGNLQPPSGADTIDFLRLSFEQNRSFAKTGSGQTEGGNAEKHVLAGGIMALHFLSILWKVLFATIPPPSYCGGWLTFTVALVYIAMLTAVIGDAAGQLGCAVGLSDLVTAISLVAVGTSLPDLFASKQAVTDGTNADAAVGNITGSNSVNVFLGLGLPWLLASLYYTSKGERFCYPVSGTTPAALPLPLPLPCPAPDINGPAPDINGNGDRNMHAS
jgi:Ca2+/Na+ antiporter